MQVVTFATQRFAPFLHLWSKFPGISTRLESVEVVAGDQVADRAAREAGIGRVARFEGEPAVVDGSHRWLRPFWARRFSEIARRVRDREVIHSDLDAFWLADAGTQLSDLDFDLAFSVAHAMPRRAVERWGFSLCCGLFASRPTPSTRGFLGEWAEEVARVEDDQVALNSVLLGKDVSWAPGRNGTLVLEARSGRQPLRILALPESVARRAAPYSSPGAVVAHPFFEREFFESFRALYQGIYGPAASVDQAVIAAELAGLRHTRGSEAELWDLAALLTLLEADPSVGACAAHAGVLLARVGLPKEAAGLLGSLGPDILARSPSAALAVQDLSRQGLIPGWLADEAGRMSSGDARGLWKVAIGMARRGRLVSAARPMLRAMSSVARAGMGSASDRFGRQSP